MYKPTGFAEIIFKERYASHKEETWEEACERVSTAVARAETNGKFIIWKQRFYDLLLEGKFCPGGRIWYGAGRPKQQLLNCVSGDTAVHTKNGVYFAKDLAGMEIETLSKGGVFRKAKWNSFGRQKVYLITFSNGDTIKATGEHEWIVTKPKGGTERVKTIELIDRNVPLYPIKNVEYNEKEWKEGVQRGLVYGDGSVHSSIDKSFLVQFGDSQHLIVDHFDSYTERDNSAGKHLYTGSFPPEWKKELPTGKETISYLRGFIAGLIGADGHVDSRGHTMLHQSSLEAITHIRKLAALAGLPTTSITISREKSPFTGEYAPNYKLSFVKAGVYDPKMILKNKHKENMFNSPEPNKLATMKVASVLPLGEEEVFCCEEPETNTWVTLYGYLTSNCFVLPAGDSREGWGKVVSDTIVVSGTGGGVGINGSAIRPRGTPIHGTGGIATGAVSLFDIINSAGEVIKAGGGRRTALMLCLDIAHPDVVEFIDKKFTKIKRDGTDYNDIRKFLSKEFGLHSLPKEIDKAILTLSHTIDEIDQEAWQDFIQGISDLFLQRNLKNANVSIVFSDDPEEFFEKIRNNEKWELKWQDQIVTTVSAKELWDKIITNFLEGGEPGILNGHLANKMNNIHYLRPLISTNPCITGDTLIAVADGRNAVSIKQLTEEGKDVPVYSTNLKTGKVEIKMGRVPRLTGKKKEVWKLTLDDGSILRATPNHKILKKNLEYVELKDLKVGDSIFPFNSFNSNGYRQISNVGAKMSGGARRNRRQYRLIYEFYNGEVNAKNYAIHHIDFNSKNDRIDNLKLMLHEDHRKLHSERMRGDKNPYHKMTNEWKKNFAIHSGESNGRYSGITNDELLEHGKILFDTKGKVSQSLWVEYAKINNLPQFLANDFRFGSFTNFKNQVSNNHKVVSVEFVGYEDVYNITVDDNHNYHVVTSSDDSEFITSSGICVKNCGEIWLEKYGCCDLGALVLSRFLNEDKTDFDWAALADAITAGVRFLDNVLTVNHYPLPEIEQNCQELRRIGLGVMALHDALLMMGIKYSSEEGLEKVDQLFNFIKNKAYEASTYLAVEKGPFPLYEQDGFMKSGFVKTLKRSVKAKIKEYGVRNCAMLTIAPTGTTGILMGLVSTGIEPIFGPAWWRIFYSNENGESNGKKKELVFHTLFAEMYKEGKSLEHFECSYDIKPEDHMKIQAVCQKHIDNAVSKTINIPAKGFTLEEFSEALMEYIPKLKGLTVYKAGSRGDEPLQAIPMKEAIALIEKSKEIKQEVDKDQLLKQDCPDGVCLI